MEEAINLELTVDTEVNPTEDTDKVKAAIFKTLGNLNLEVVEDGYVKRLTCKAGGPESLSRLYELLRQERILDAARKVLYRGIRGDRITFYLNKQAAYVGHLSFSLPIGESPLGPIHVEIRCDKPAELIDWLAPRTRFSKARGRPLS